MDETEIFNNLNNYHNLIESDLDKIDIKSPLENQIQQQEMRDSGWRFDKINSITVYCYNTVEMKRTKFCKNSFENFCYSRY